MTPWGTGRVRTLVLLVATIVLLALLAYNLRAVDPGEEDLPPTSGTDPAEEGRFAGEFVLWSYVFTIIILAPILVGTFILVVKSGGGLRNFAFVASIITFIVAVTLLVFILLSFLDLELRLGELLGEPEGEGEGSENEQPPAGDAEVRGPSVLDRLLLGSRATWILVIAMFALSIVMWYYMISFSKVALRRADRGGSAAGAAVEQDRKEMARAVLAAIDDLEAGGDFRIAVLRCYRAMIGLFQPRGVGTDPSETAREVEAEALRHLRLSAAGIRTLTGLFEEARYSEHPIGPAERDTAITSLRSVRAELEGTA